MRTIDLSLAPDAPTFAVANRRCVLIAANPYGGARRIRRVVAELAASLAQHGLEPRVIWDSAERSVVLADTQLLQGCRCVVAAGGDGTVADVINDLACAIPLATWPVGNENLFARQFGFKRELGRLAKAIAAGRTRPIDLGRGNGRLFSLMLSAGFDADVVCRVARQRTRAGRVGRVNRLSYAKPILDTLRSYPYSPIELDADGVRVRGTHCLVFNLPQYGLQLPFAPGVRPDDGWLDWLVFERPGLWHLMSYLGDLARSKHLGRSDVYHGQARRIQIGGPAPVPVQMDGDPAGFTPIEVMIVPQALNVVVP